MISLNPKQKNMTRNSSKIKKHFTIKLNLEDCLMTASCREKTVDATTMYLLLLLVKVKSQLAFSMTSTLRCATALTDEDVKTMSFEEKSK